MQLSLKQELQLTMTLQLRQAIELLQLSNLELEQFIREQELQNPLIQLKEPRLKEYFSTPHFAPSTSDNLIEKKIANKTNLRQELLQQINCTYKDIETIQLLCSLVNHLNTVGYLTDIEQLPYSSEQIKSGIYMLQQFGPHGIAARNVQECLLLQCEFDPHCPPYAKEIIANHLEAFANQNKKEILRALPIKLPQLLAIEEYIKSLQPSFFIEEDIEIQHITPDVIVMLENNELQFMINDRYLPKISIVPEYTQFIKQDESSYFKKCYNDYNWLLTSIEQRRQNMIKVMRVLLRLQRNFFLVGEHALEPLTLREVAEQIDVHESTVSRITTNKYVQTPFGTFELKKLFTSKLQTSNGGTISQNKVKQLLLDYINNENRSKPYTDQKICDYFTQVHEIEISRRTIAKYREELYIPNASKRKCSNKIYKL